MRNLFARRPDRPGPITAETAVGHGQPLYPAIAGYGVVGDTHAQTRLFRTIEQVERTSAPGRKHGLAVIRPATVRNERLSEA